MAGDCSLLIELCDTYMYETVWTVVTDCRSCTADLPSSQVAQFVAIVTSFTPGSLHQSMGRGKTYCVFYCCVFASSLRC